MPRAPNTQGPQISWNPHPSTRRVSLREEGTGPLIRPHPRAARYSAETASAPSLRRDATAARDYLSRSPNSAVPTMPVPLKIPTHSGDSCYRLRPFYGRTIRVVLPDVVSQLPIERNLGNTLVKICIKVLG